VALPILLPPARILTCRAIETPLDLGVSLAGEKLVTNDEHPWGPTHESRPERLGPMLMLAAVPAETAASHVQAEEDVWWSAALAIGGLVSDLEGCNDRAAGLPSVRHNEPHKTIGHHACPHVTRAMCQVRDQLWFSRSGGYRFRSQRSPFRPTPRLRKGAVVSNRAQPSMCQWCH
jgi:hypothetical protein